jgi:hypothetical protein
MAKFDLAIKAEEDKHDLEEKSELTEKNSE